MGDQAGFEGQPTTCPVDWNAFGDHIAPYQLTDLPPCDVSIPSIPLVGSGTTACVIGCVDGYTSSFPPQTKDHIAVGCYSKETISVYSQIDQISSVKERAYTEFEESGAELGLLLITANQNNAQELHLFATDLDCKANNCISTADKELAKKDTHIFCTNSNIASGTTGNCKCEDFGDKDKLRAPQTTTPTTIMSVAASSGHRIAEFVSAGHMFLVALSTLV